jgi:hypothetical protein
MQDIFELTSRRLEKWKDQPDVLGVLLVGSKSRGYGDGLSDDDLEVVLTDEACAKIAPTDCHDLVFEGEGEGRRLIWDAQYLALGALQAKSSSHIDLDHWPYESVGILFDRDGRVSQAAEAAARMSPEFRRKRLQHGTIDAAFPPFRAKKTFKRGWDAAGRALVARGAKALCRVLFALEWRWVPLDHWLEKELASLEDPTQAGPEILRALRDMDPDPLIEALRGLEARYTEEIPRRESWNDVFLELIHPSRFEERSRHGLH